MRIKRVKRQYNDGYVLIYANDIKCLQKAKRKVGSNTSIIVITEEYELYERIEYTPSCKIILVDNDHPVFRKETWEIIKDINRIIGSLRLKNESFLYEISYLVEGGTAQNIADYLYILDFVINAIRDYNIISVVLACDSNTVESVLKSISRSIGAMFLSIQNMRPLTGLMESIRRSFIGCFAREYLCVRNIISAHMSCSKDTYKEIYDVGHVCCFSDNKQIGGYEGIITRYLSTFDFAMICYGAKGSYRYFKSRGIPAVAVERYFSIFETIRCIHYYRMDRLKILKTIRTSLISEYSGIDISDVMKYQVRLNVDNVSLNNTIYEKLVRGLIKKHRFKLITGDGDTNYISNRLFSRISQEYYDKTICYKDLRGLWNVDESIVFEPYCNDRQLGFFLNNSPYARTLITQGWKGEAIYCGKEGYVTKLKKQSDVFPKHEKVCVLWAPSYPVKGHYGYTSFLKDNDYVIGELSKENVELYIKYHPSQAVILSEKYKRIYEAKMNIHFVDQKESIAPWIEICDLVITTPSTVMFDAAEMGKPVIVLAEGPGRNIIRNMTRGFLISRRNGSWCSYLKLLLNDSATLNRMLQRIVRRQSGYLLDCYISDETRSIGELLAEKLEEF